MEMARLESLESANILKSELQTARNTTIDAETRKKSKRVTKEKNQRVWNVQQVLDRSQTSSGEDRGAQDAWP